MAHPPTHQQSHSTAVAQLYSGAVLDITKVDATPAYKSLIERLANAPSPLPPSRLALWHRWWNEHLGRPATADVGVLASLLSDLKFATSTTLTPHPIDLVAITHPSIPALTPLDLADALSHAGLRSWFTEGSKTRTRFQPKHVVQSRAAFAGNGHGLCVSYRDLFRCWHENDDLTSHSVLFVSLTRHTLYASVDVMREAFPKWGRDGPRVMDLGAGLDDRMGSPRRANTGRMCAQGLLSWWGGVSKHRRWGWCCWGLRMEPMLVFWQLSGTPWMSWGPGEGVTGPLDVDVAAVADPIFAAARGMAMYARRRQEGPGHCRERWKCIERRDKERNEGRTEL
jgi:hypothetical protein